MPGGGGPSVLSGIDLLMNPRKKNSSAGSDAGSICSGGSGSGSIRISRGSSVKAMPVADHPQAMPSAPAAALKWPPPRPVQRVVDEYEDADDGGGYDDDDDDIAESESGDGSGGSSSSGSSVVAAAATRFMHLSPEEILRKKREILYELARIERKGVQLPRRYTMDDPLEDMRAELDRLRLDRELDVSVRFQRKMLMTCITGIELLNGKFDPFNVKLDGWSDSLHENLGDYDEVFEDLHMKYRGKAKMAPEIKLMMMVAGSGVMFHFTNSMFRASAASVPGFDEVMRQNPHLMRQYAEAAAHTSAAKAPGGGGGGLFGNIGNLFGGLFGGSPPPGMARPAAPVAVPQQQQQQQQQGPMMRGPKPVNEVLHELHRNAFGGASPSPTSMPMPPMPVNTRPYTDSDRIEIISNASDADTHISELADIVPAAAPSTAAKKGKAPRASGGKRKTGTAA